MYSWLSLRKASSIVILLSNSVGYEDRRSELTEGPCLVFPFWRAPVNSLTADLHLCKQPADLDV